MEIDSRKIAYEILLKVEKEKSYSNIALDRAINKYKPRNIEKNLITTLFYGVLEKKIYLDYVINTFSKKPIDTDKIELAIILRLAVYQIIYMDKIPDSAAVNYAVSQVGYTRYKDSKAYCNAVLRKITQNKENIDLPKKGTDLYYSVLYSCPKVIVRLWRNSYGDKITEDILKSLSGKPPLTISINTLKITKEKILDLLKEEEIQFEEIDFLKNSLNLTSSESIINSELFKKGYFYIQDASSQLSCEIIPPKSGETIIDVCAAPGGKSIKTALLMNNEGKIYSYDIYQKKIDQIKENAEKLGIKIIEAKQEDALNSDLSIKADRVICDVPCSGLGIIRRKPEIRYKDDLGIKSLPNIQYEILKNNSKYVKTGGILIYTTCTLNIEENNKVVQKFLDENKDFSEYNFELPIGIERTIKERENCLTLFPFTNNTDGFFISAFKRIT